ncbi:MAG: 3-hydroxyacyl-CoA dehydrogenase family protein [Bacteroidota bacterium]|nr:3-hydroxyacyl-CoA dehydrogenase family protein [Bacteroidota bacterium]
MTNTDRIQNVAVLGAAGKMGSGILYLSTLYISQIALAPENRNKTFTIYAIDQSQERLNGLLKYTRDLLLKWAEKNTVWLRSAYRERTDLIENCEIIQEYMENAMALIKPTTRIESAFESTLIFEAVIENIELKTHLLGAIKKNNPLNPWFLTNTSSIPIEVLNAKAQLEGNIIGCHFYNPPAVQRLIEVIELKNGNKELVDWVNDFGQMLDKVMVPANDIAGFIGNGFFMRDLLFGIEKINQLQPEFTFAESVLLIDTLTRDFMLRPMGIFQLTDYVGIDVCSFILKVMNNYLPEELHSEILPELLEKKISGGQNSDGSQKAGLFTYAKGKIEMVYDLPSGRYIPVVEIIPKLNTYLGELPENLTWKSLSGNRDKELLIKGFFEGMKRSDSRGAKLAMEYMKKMKSIGENLVSQGVTETGNHVNTVMITGFHHLYGPINEYC